MDAGRRIANGLVQGLSNRIDLDGILGAYGNLDRLGSPLAFVLGLLFVFCLGGGGHCSSRAWMDGWKTLGGCWGLALQSLLRSDRPCHLVMVVFAPHRKAPRGKVSHLVLSSPVPKNDRRDSLLIF